jgi:hypothetical protein
MRDAGFDVSFRDCPTKGGMGGHPNVLPFLVLHLCSVIWVWSGLPISPIYLLTHLHKMLYVQFFDSCMQLFWFGLSEYAQLQNSLLKFDDIKWKRLPKHKYSHKVLSKFRILHAYWFLQIKMHHCKKTHDLECTDDENVLCHMMLGWGCQQTSSLWDKHGINVSSWQS